MQRLAGALVMTIVLGLASRAFPIDLVLWDKVAGDSLYAVAVYLVVALLSLLVHRPQRPVIVAAVSLVTCWVIEAFQATGFVADHVRSGAVRYVLGTGFAWADLAWYAIGVLAIALIDQLWLRPGAATAEGPVR